MRHWNPLRIAIPLLLLTTAAAGPANAQTDLPVNLTTAVIGSGTILRSPDQTFYDIGTTVSLTAQPGDGFVFQAWSGPVADPLSAETTILLKTNTLVSATFVPSGKPQLKTDPAAGEPLDFGTVETGLLSSPTFRTVTLTNTGGGTLEGTAAIRDGASRPYGILTGSTFTLNAGESAQVLLRFDPFTVDLNAGSVPVAGELLLTSNGGNAEIPLTGNAIASGELACSCATTRPGGPIPWGDALLLLTTLTLLAIVRPVRRLAPVR